MVEIAISIQLIVSQRSYIKGKVTEIEKMFE